MGNANSVNKLNLFVAPFKKNQTKYLDLLGERDITTNYLLNMKQSIVPEITLKLLLMSIDNNLLSQETKKLSYNSSPEELSDGYVDMYENAEIELDDGVVRKNYGNYDLYYCDKTGIYWKIKKGVHPSSLYEEALQALIEKD